ncbi:hypothetical protein RHSIM_Rhsim02G0048400 [Rhododendron simsii]|uniref:S-protein homolog n=1 Tax=Rhododendron simsii TaxID=118357 RepID=A0A834HDH3_RHOSS|nr:hypothetical protein RHSIM_Rhsim02G0048400 [Rhododendron simsii]
MKYYFLPLAIVAFHFVCMQTLSHEEQDLIVLLPPRKISIRYISTAGPLNFRCASKYDDTKQQTLLYNQEFHWEFDPYFTKDIPNYLCHFSVGAVEKTFIIYNLLFDKRCTRNDSHVCYWLVSSSGFALGNDGVSYNLYKTHCSLTNADVETVGFRSPVASRIRIKRKLTEMIQLTIVNSETSGLGIPLKVTEVRCGLPEVGSELPTNFLIIVEVMCSEIICLWICDGALQNARDSAEDVYCNHFGKLETSFVVVAPLFVCKRRAVLGLRREVRSESCIVML